jgi:uncharacterized membrane protein
MRWSSATSRRFFFCAYLNTLVPSLTATLNHDTDTPEITAIRELLKPMADTKAGQKIQKKVEKLDVTMEMLVDPR